MTASTTASTQATIAAALHRYVADTLSQRRFGRRFFRLSGFEPEVYAALLARLAQRAWRIDETALEVRSIGPIAGYEDRLLGADRSATWYRNNLPATQALILIQNRASTDAQSLKDLFAVTEQTLSHDAIDQLVDASFSHYQLDRDARKTLINFMRRFARTLFEPQLRALTEFLLDVHRQLHARSSLSIESAIVSALPHLDLFRCRELEPYLNTLRGDKLLRQLRQAARIGGEVIEERDQQLYRERIERASFDDDESIGGLTIARKRDLLRRYVEGELRDNATETLEVLRIDWREIQLVIIAKERVTRETRLSDLRQQIVAALPAADRPDVLADLLDDLGAGRAPESETLDRALAEAGDGLPRTLRNELRRLVKRRSRRCSDLILGLTTLAVELLQPLQDDLQPGTRLQVMFVRDDISDTRHLADAALALRTLCGGVERSMPSVEWQLTALWACLSEPRTNDDAADDDQARGRAGQLDLPFRVTVYGADGGELTSADLIWRYRSDSAAAATTATLAAESARLRRAAPATQLRVPIFNSCPANEHVGDLDISRPIASFGTWYETSSDLRTLLHAALRRQIAPQAEAALFTALDNLERGWAGFVQTAAADGLLAADIGALLHAYECLLATAAEWLQTSGEARAYQVINQAWAIGTADFTRWAVVPLLHPLKLLWWRERVRAFDSLIRLLLAPGQPTRVVDEQRFRRELPGMYGSSGFPAVLALAPAADRSRLYVPAEEADGYELYFPVAGGGDSFGLEVSGMADDEATIAAQRAVDGLVGVVQDYIETYPFVRDGLEIVLFECRNGALPGMLVDRIAKVAARRGWEVRLSVIVHTSDRGAPLFRRVSEWVEAQQDVVDREASYFPPVSLKVLQCSPEQLMAAREDKDIVILADVLAERGQHVGSDVAHSALADVPLAGFLPTYQAQQEPFARGETYRRIVLSQPTQPAVVRLFGLAQHAALSRRPVVPSDTALFHRDITLESWERDLGKLHDHFNWVICYDPTIDRFLLQSTFPDQVQVIRYSLGLGAKRQHNLTVSSSGKAQSIVERRLASRLSQMLPQASPEFRQQVAGQLVAQAKHISGDIVLRAAGPGAFLNEVIGLVMARFLTERRHHAQHAESLVTWILLDDFAHWFGGGKFPDLLFVAIERGRDAVLHLRLTIIEVKCVGALSFDVEARDAEEQVRRGVSRLAAAFAAGGQHLDALYWYDQLYRAVAGNLIVERAQQPLWDLFSSQLQRGTFSATVEGHVWAFCHDGQIDGATGPDEHPIAKRAPDAQDVPLIAHHYGRNELCQALRLLIDASGVISPPSAWESAPPTIPQVPAAPPVAPLVAPLVAPPAVERQRPVAHAATEVPAAGAALPSAALPSIEPDTAEQTWLREKARDLERALRQRGVQIMPIDPALADVGPSIVRFKFRLRPNESVRKLANVADDLARDLALAHAPIMANVQRTTFVGIDIPRAHPQTIALRPLLDQLGSPAPAELPIIFGIAPNGALIVEDLSEFPHLLVAGATGSGKSVFLRSLLLSLMTQYAPGQLELLVVDPKQTDFSFFDGLPYLRGGTVFTSPPEAREALLELVRVEMPRRQQLIRGRSMKVKDFNRRYPDEALPPIVALIDEYAQLMTLLPKKEGEQFERDLMSLGAVARSVSIHLVLATQRPSADVVTSTLKANLDARVAFRVASNINSRVILDQAGAESLLGKGDMLFRKPSGEIMRLQAPFMDEEEMQAYLATLLARPTHTARS